MKKPPKDPLVHTEWLGDDPNMNALNTASTHLKIAEMHIKNGSLEFAGEQMTRVDKILESLGFVQATPEELWESRCKAKEYLFK